MCRYRFDIYFYSASIFVGQGCGDIAQEHCIVLEISLQKQEQFCTLFPGVGLDHVALVTVNVELLHLDPIYPKYSNVHAVEKHDMGKGCDQLDEPTRERFTMEEIPLASGQMS